MFEKVVVPSKFANAKIRNLYSKASSAPGPTGGEIGIEFELEGVGVQTHLQSKFGMNPEITNWSYHNDGSLDDTGGEYVFTKPVTRSVAKKQVSDFYEYIDQNKTKITLNLSPRCSTHIHLNFANFTVSQTVLFLVMYYSYEDALIKAVAPERVGNRFCLSLSDSHGIGEYLIDDLKIGSFQKATSHYRKYSACNIAALAKFGTLEFRAMGGCADANLLNKWLDALLDLYDFAKLNPKLTPDFFMSSLSSSSFEAYTASNFPAVFNLIKNLPDLSQYLDKGVWNAQNIAYAVDWSEVVKYNTEKKERATNKTYPTGATPSKTLSTTVKPYGLSPPKKKSMLATMYGTSPTPIPFSSWDD